MPCCSMCLLLVLCLSTAAGVPVRPPQGVTAAPAPADTGVRGASSWQSDSSETLEELQEDLIVQEGDILMPEVRNAVQSLWPDATVPYVISHDLADRKSDIDTAFTMISNATCIRFKIHTKELNYLDIKEGEGCASFVGCQGGAQSLYYGRSCRVGNLCHELVHALGLHHEHTRDDRDQYVSVQWESITPGRQNNFKVKHGDTLNLPYDIDSIMHYGWFFFSQDGSPTLLPKRGGDQMGQRTHLSQLDIQKLNSLYHCAERMTPQ
ncbi:zinc metalloproteinase nas-14-like [Hippoglossus hippoglossus]|uniref:zinc metalloproteinase nas-14-like n=1 Tax=Hippoglossus hippoglossus TaxID=8267 RepID=UPI00148B4325|nr:zinc metalloproteinase nas-14-like [Hippoglossus hippoglossus]